jgi:gliding motility-associated-like protein
LLNFYQIKNLFSSEKLSGIMPFFLFFLSNVTLSQQNLIQNGDFEDFTNCPVGFSSPFQNPKEIEKCIGWSAPTYGTSDFFNTCAVGTNVDVPLNASGEQVPYNGNGYLGCLFTSYTGGSGSDGYMGIMWWEYLQGKLISPLEGGRVYKLSLEMSVAELSDLYINEIGAFFSEFPITSQNTAALNLAPQCVFYEPNFFKDTLNWIHLETYFLASGSEQYITIGNFKDNISTDTIRGYDLYPMAENPFKTYMYIDNVILTLDFENSELANCFSPNGDGINDYWNLPFKGGNHSVTIYNRWGNLVYKADLKNFQWSGLNLSGDKCSEGTYFYCIENTNINGFIQLMR